MHFAAVKVEGNAPQRTHGLERLGDLAELKEGRRGGHQNAI
jgi:hypothetical protein